MKEELKEIAVHFLELENAAMRQAPNLACQDLLVAAFSSLERTLTTIFGPELTKELDEQNEAKPSLLVRWRLGRRK